MDFNAIFRGKIHRSTVLIIPVKRVVDMTIVSQLKTETIEPMSKDVVGGVEVSYKRQVFATLEYLITTLVGASF